MELGIRDLSFRDFPLLPAAVAVLLCPNVLRFADEELLEEVGVVSPDVSTTALAGACFSALTAIVYCIFCYKYNVFRMMRLAIEYRSVWRVYVFLEQSDQC